MSAEHGWTRHGHRCCDQATGPRPPLATCGGLAICRECAADAAIRHSPGSGTFAAPPSLVDAVHAVDVAAAESRGRVTGWREAIEALRASPPDPYQLEDWANMAADLLESLAPKETP